MTAKHPRPCGAVFKVGTNAPASCALRFNHLGAHRDWMRVADDREELMEAIRRAEYFLLDRVHLPNGPGFAETLRDVSAAIATVIAKAEGKS